VVRTLPRWAGVYTGQGRNQGIPALVKTELDSMYEQYKRAKQETDDMAWRRRWANPCRHRA